MVLIPGNTFGYSNTISDNYNQDMIGELNLFNI